MNVLPPGVARHFPGETLALEDSAARTRILGRLLEDGDRADLAWLGSHFSTAEIATWYELHAARRLSRRSRAFWSAVLGRTPPPAPTAIAEALWPLA